MLLSTLCGAPPALSKPPAQAKLAPAAVRPADLKVLSASERERFDQVAADEYCSCTSSLTLAGCLANRPTCQIAQDVAQILARAAARHVPAKAMSAFASQAIVGPFCGPATTFKLDKAPRLGPKGAPITVVEFADFRCTHCRHAVPVVHETLKLFKNKVQLIYAPMVLDENSPSLPAAEASMAAAAQNKFWPMHQALFAREAGDFDAQTLLAAAKSAGLNIKRYEADMASHKHRETLLSFSKEALAAGLTGTPLFFINGRRYEFEPEIFPLADRIQMELDRNVGQCE